MDYQAFKNEFKQDVNNNLNPFFTGIDGGSVLKISAINLYKNYNYTYVLCLKDNLVNDNFYSKIYNKEFDEKEAFTIFNKFVLIKSHISLMKNYELKKYSNLVEGTFLDKYFKKDDGTNYDFDQIVIPMFDLNESSVRNYMNLYNNTTLDELKKVASFEKYYSKRDSFYIDSQMIEFINNLDKISFWKNPENCKLNINELFNKRTLTYNGYRLDKINYNKIDSVNSSIDDILSLKNKKKYIVNNGYSSDNDEKEEKEENIILHPKQINIATILYQSKNLRKFYINNDDFTFTKDNIADFFDNMTNEKYRFNLLNTLLVSKEYCHFVVNNKRVLQRNSDLFDKYRIVYAYLFGYSSITLSIEESLSKSKLTKDNRCVLDFDTASELPSFPFSMENIHNNPYCSLLLDRDLINATHNCISINALEDYKNYYGICNNEEALKRFNIFTSGKSSINIFKDIDPTIFSFSGSFITAISHKKSPLLELCTTEQMSYDEKYDTYFHHYYNESDIDVMCSVYAVNEFILNSSIFLNTIIKNIECKRDDITVNATKTTSLTIYDSFFDTGLNDLNNECGTEYTRESLIELFKQSLLKEENNDIDVKQLPAEIIRYFYSDYIIEKNQSIKKWSLLYKDENYCFDKELVAAYNTITAIDNISIKLSLNNIIVEDNLKKNDNEIYCFTDMFTEEPIQKDKNVLLYKFTENIKYKFHSLKLRRPIELFKIFIGDHFNKITQFHVPSVRAYLQDNKFYCTHAFIGYALTHITDEYMFAYSKNPIDIINKNMMRGVSFIFNSTEKKAIYLHNKNIINNGLYKVNNEQESFGSKDLNNKIYKPLVYKLNLSENIYNKSEHKYINNIDELKQYYNRYYNRSLDMLSFDILKITAISKDGTVNPVKMWVANEFYDFINQQ